MVEFALAGSEGLKGKNFSSSPLLTVIVPASGRQERIYLLTKELEEKVARLHLLALGAELTASAMKREDTMQAVDGSVVLSARKLLPKVTPSAPSTCPGVTSTSTHWTTRRC